jgi:hypothetical protein
MDEDHGVAALAIGLSRMRCARQEEREYDGKRDRESVHEGGH